MDCLCLCIWFVVGWGLVGAVLVCCSCAGLGKLYVLVVVGLEVFWVW